MNHQVILNISEIRPKTVEIKSRDSVSWVNQSAETHCVVFNTGDYKSKDLRQGDSFELVFVQKGRYDYYCEDNEGMVGKVIVH